MTGWGVDLLYVDGLGAAGGAGLHEANKVRRQDRAWARGDVACRSKLHCQRGRPWPLHGEGELGPLPCRRKIVEACLDVEESYQVRCAGMVCLLPVACHGAGEGSLSSALGGLAQERVAGA